MIENKIKQWLESRDDSFDMAVFKHLFDKIKHRFLNHTLFCVNHYTELDAEDFSYNIILKLKAVKYSIRPWEENSLIASMWIYISKMITNYLIDAAKPHKKKEGSITIMIESITSSLESNDNIDPDSITLSNEDLKDQNTQIFPCKEFYDLPDDSIFDYFRKWWLWEMSIPTSLRYSRPILPQSTLHGDEFHLTYAITNLHNVHTLFLARHDLWLNLEQISDAG